MRSQVRIRTEKSACRKLAHADQACWISVGNSPSRESLPSGRFAVGSQVSAYTGAHYGSSAETSSEALRAKLSARWRSPPFKARVDCAKNVRASSSVLPSAPESLARLSLAIRRRISSCNPWIWRRRAASSAELSRGSREGTWGVGGGSVVSGVFSVSPAGGSVRSTRRGRRADSGGEVG